MKDDNPVRNEQIEFVKLLFNKIYPAEDQTPVL
jgi:hypothetical protein